MLLRLPYSKPLLMGQLYASDTVCTCLDDVESYASEDT